MRLADLETEMEVPVIIADSRGVITRVNRPLAQLFGWEISEMLGEPITMIIPPSLRGAHQAGFSRFLATGESRLLNQSIRLKAVRKDGCEFVADHFIISEVKDGQRFFAATIREVVPRSS